MGDQDTEREEAAIYAIVALAVAPVVIAALVTGPFDGGATLCMTLLCVAIAGLVRRPPECLPRVRIHVRDRRFRRTRRGPVVSTRP